MPAAHTSPRRNASMRSVRDTAIHDTATALYGVLLGLALLHPFELVTSDIVAQPLGGNWPLRFAFAAFFAEIITYIHALLGDMNLESVAAPDFQSHPAEDGLPGYRQFGEYGRAVRDLWLGSVAVALFFLVGAALPVGSTTFLAWFVVYLGWDLLLEAAYLLQEPSVALERLNVAIRSPRQLVSNVRRQRRIPVLEEDLAAERAGSPQTEVGDIDRVGQAWVDATWYEVGLDLIELAATGAALAVISSSAAMALPVMGIWLGVVLGCASLDYYMVPQEYAA